jgi:hypothetical protein
MKELGEDCKRLVLVLPEPLEVWFPEVLGFMREQPMDRAALYLADVLVHQPPIGAKPREAARLSIRNSSVCFCKYPISCEREVPVLVGDLDLSFTADLQMTERLRFEAGGRRLLVHEPTMGAKRRWAAV